MEFVEGSSVGCFGVVTKRAVHKLLDALWSDADFPRIELEAHGCEVPFSAYDQRVALLEHLVNARCYSTDNEFDGCLHQRVRYEDFRQFVVEVCEFTVTVISTFLLCGPVVR